jgi:hypothetical protein
MLCVTAHWTSRLLAQANGFGGARRDRTADLLHAMQALSQLSYGPNILNNGKLRMPLRCSDKPQGV